VEPQALAAAEYARTPEPGMLQEARPFHGGPSR
jgi:hypothetical protein